MHPVLSRQQMQAMDRTTIQDVGIPDLVLMEVAGRAVLDVVLEKLEDDEPVAVVAGVATTEETRWLSPAISPPRGCWSTS